MENEREMRKQKDKRTKVGEEIEELLDLGAFVGTKNILML